MIDKEEFLVYFEDMPGIRHSVTNQQLVDKLVKMEPGTITWHLPKRAEGTTTTLRALQDYLGRKDEEVLYFSDRSKQWQRRGSLARGLSAARGTVLFDLTVAVPRLAKTLEPLLPEISHLQGVLISSPFAPVFEFGKPSNFVGRCTKHMKQVSLFEELRKCSNVVDAEPYPDGGIILKLFYPGDHNFIMEKYITQRQARRMRVTIDDRGETVLVLLAKKFENKFGTIYPNSCVVVPESGQWFTRKDIIASKILPDRYFVSWGNPLEDLQRLSAEHFEHQMDLIA